MKRVRFGDVVERANTKEDRFNTEKKFYVGGEHMETGEYLVTKRGTIAGSNIGPMFYCGFKAGQVLLASRSPDLKKAGMVTFDGICSEKTFVIQTKNEDVLLQTFLPAIVRSEDFWKYANENQSGSVNHFINWSTFANYEFFLPDIEEQKRVADLLWAFERTKNAYRSLLSKTDELVKSQFIEMFGELEINTKNYPVRKLNEIASFWNGLTYKPTDVVQDGSGTLVLRSSNIQNGALSFEDNVRVSCPIKDKLYVQDYDILMCSRNGSAALVGKAAIIKNLPEPMTFGAFMMIIRSKYYPYLKTYFEMPAFRNQVTTGTTTINQITGGMLNQIELPVPNMDEVLRFERLVEQSDKSKFETMQLIDDIINAERLLICEALNQ